MNNLLRKELTLSIDKLYLVFPVIFGALFLIPKWPFFLALMYFFFIAVPNISSAYNVQKDIEFSMILPVRKQDVVKARIYAFSILELMHIAAGAVFAVVHNLLYGSENFLLNLNPAFFGIALSMYGLFNLVFFPIYFKSAYRIGVPVILANIAAIVYIAGVELFALASPRVGGFFQYSVVAQVVTLAGGALLFVLLNTLSCKLAITRFENVDV